MSGAFARAVMNWISEATCQIVTLLEGDRITDDDIEVMRQITVDACDRCWTALETNHDAAPAAKGPAHPHVRREGAIREDAEADACGAVAVTGKQPAPPCVEIDGFSCGSRTGQINRTPERQSPAREREESSPRDVPQPDNGLATGGPGHHTPEPLAVGRELCDRLKRMNDAIEQKPVAYMVEVDGIGSIMPLCRDTVEVDGMRARFGDRVRRVILLYAAPQDRVVRLPKAPGDLEISEANGYAIAFGDISRALDAAGVKWEVGE